MSEPELAPVVPIGATPSEGGGLTFTVQGTQAAGFVDDLVSETAALMSVGALVSRQAVQDELDMMKRTIRQFWDMEPDQVMRAISAMSARCMEMITHLERLENKREFMALRTRDAEKVYIELDRQFKIASRMLEMRRQDIELSR